MWCRDKLNRCICSSSHRACAVLAAFLSRKDLPITVSQTSVVTTFEQRGNLYHHLYLALWEFSAEASELFTIADGAAACIGDRVRAGGGRTWSSGTSHWTTLQEMKRNMLTKENNRQEAYVNVCVVPGRCIRSKGFLGRGTNARSWGWLHCRSSLPNQVQFIYPWKKWPDYCRQLDFASTHVHILHSIVLVACKGGCSLHSMGSWCRQRPLRNSSTCHMGRCHQQTQCHLHILYRDTCSLQANNWKNKLGEMALIRKCMISGSSPGAVVCCC